MIRRIVLSIVAAFILATMSSAGPLFDDFLNYARMGENSSGNSDEVTLTPDRPLGQTFAVSPGTGEIYRIGVQANSEPDSWGEGEVVTLSLYDSPAKTRKLAAYTIDWQTCRHRGKKHDEKVRILMFPLRAKLSGERSLYYELTMTGGDGKVRFKYDPSGGYKGGSGYQDGKEQSWDLAFETHVKPVADRIANLKAFWEKVINLEHPSLAAVKEAVQAGDYDKAEEEFVKHFQNRMDLYEPALFQPNPDPNYDRTFADLFMSGKLYRTQDKKLVETIPWRVGSYWAPDYVKWGKEYEPDVTGGWHIERTLWGAYSATGDPKYARAGMDMRIQWILDCVPSPRVTGIDLPHDIWNELSAGRGRAPGHLPYVYSRVHEFSGFSTDEKMLYFLNWYENALYCYRSDVGGNWGFQAADVVYSFGRDFPEYALHKDFMSWGAQRLTELSLETVRGDGTENEASIKYHAMCARRLKELMQDYQKGVVKLDEQFVPKLKKYLEGMYDHMAHTLQPNNRVVMCGDAWYEDYSEELAEVGRMINRPDLVWIATQGREGKRPESASRAYTDGGYYIMRSDFGGDGKPYTDARQMFVHNGGWVGSHGHFDLLSIALYGYGRTLLVDPGGMWDSSFPAVWWKSNIHSMLVPNSWDCGRDPGSTLWVSSRKFDYLDGVHHGYAKQGVERVRRRIVFMKPDYYVVDDSTSGAPDEYQWDQVWNVCAPKDKVKIDNQNRVVETAYPTDGNLIIYPVCNTQFDIVTRPLQFPMDGTTDSTIVYYRQKSRSPRYTTVLYPYKGARPDLRVSCLSSDAGRADTVTGVRIAQGDSIDLVIFGDASRGPVALSGKHLLDGDLLTVRTLAGKTIRGFSWTNAKRAVFNGRELARAETPIALLDVSWENDRVVIETREPHPSLVVWVGNARSVTLNGKRLPVLKPYKGYLRLFPDMPKTITVDDSSPGFRRLTQTTEWEVISESSAWAGTYQRHETDPGRKESAAYSATIPADGRYRVEVFIPRTTKDRSNAMCYTIRATPGRPADAGPKSLATEFGGPILSRAFDKESGIIEICVDQTKAHEGWLELGTCYLTAGKQEFLTATNRTEIDGLFPVFDAVRLTPVN